MHFVRRLSYLSHISITDGEGVQHCLLFVQSMWLHILCMILYCTHKTSCFGFYSEIIVSMKQKVVVIWKNKLPLW